MILSDKAIASIVREGILARKTASAKQFKRHDAGITDIDRIKDITKAQGGLRSAKMTTDESKRFHHAHPNGKFEIGEDVFHVGTHLFNIKVGVGAEAPQLYVA